MENTLLETVVSPRPVQARSNTYLIVMQGMKRKYFIYHEQQAQYC